MTSKKTTISMLNEMMVQQKQVVSYELIKDGGGTHVNHFIYRVSCQGLEATGEGRSKREAKHEAAEAMLYLLANSRNYRQLPASPMDSPIRTPQLPEPPTPQKVPSNVPFLNVIGQLSDLCAEHKLHDPVYLDVNEVGPPHAKTFTVECHVGSFSEDAQGKTKKQAKHEVAQKMFKKLGSIITNSKALMPYKPIEDDPMDNESEIIDAYVNLTRFKVNKVNLGLKVNDYPRQFANICDELTRQEFNSEVMDLCEAFTSVYSTDKHAFLTENESRVKECFDKFNIEFDIEEIPSVRENNFVATVTLNTFPPFVEIAKDKSKDDARFAVLKELLCSLKTTINYCQGSQ